MIELRRTFAFVALASVLMSGVAAAADQGDARQAAQVKEISMKHNTDLVETKEFSGVIFPESSNAFLSEFDSKQKLVSWTVSRDEALTAESDLKHFLKQRAPQIFKKLGQYKRQYAGVMRNNEKLIHINFFCGSSFDKSWMSETIEVDDGGDCFFHVNYDVNKRTFLDFIVNGHA